jgi:hypothetical protein
MPQGMWVRGKVGVLVFRLCQLFEFERSECSAFMVLAGIKISQFLLINSISLS